MNKRGTPNAMSGWVALLGSLLAVAIFAGDILQPQPSGIESILFVILVLITLWTPDRRPTLVVATISSVFMVLGIYLSPAHWSDTPWLMLANHLLGLLSIWGVTLLVLRRKQAEEALLRTQEELEMRVAARTAELATANAALRREVAERRQAEEALRESEERFRNLVETASEWVWEVDERGVYTYVSPRVREMLGYEPVEVLGRTPFDLMPPDEAKRVAGIIESVAAARKPFTFLESANIHKDGRLVVLETSGVPFHDADGIFRGYRGVDRDVTERRRAEERLRQREADLAHFSRLTTMGEMAAGLAHELNQPLAAIANYAGGCVRRLHSGIGADPKILLQPIEQIGAEAVRAGEIIRRLREFVRKGETQRSGADINRLIAEALTLVRPESRQRNITLVLELARDLPEVLVDAIQIEQVIVNLARNAVEAMSGNGWPRRKLTIRSSLIEDGMVEVAVSDTGVGMQEEEARRLFYPFFTTKTTGMGMGLSISRSIIEAHEGRLWSMLNPEGGMTFRFTLPLAWVDGEAETT